MAESSKAFWSCKREGYWPSSLDVCEILLEVFGVITSFAVTALLFFLRAKKSESLALLRVLSSSCLASTFLDILHDFGPPGPNTGNMYFDGLICIFWSSRFLYWYTKVVVYHSVVLFACNRAFDILQIRHFLLITEKRRLVACMLTVFIGSFFATAPQFLLAQPLVKNCACAPPTENFALLVVVYTHSFLWVALFGVIYPGILVYISIGLLVRLRYTESSALLDDELDQLSFSISQSPATADAERTECCWTASYCIIPLTAAYIATFTYDAVYQLLSAASALTYELQSPKQTFGEILLILFVAMAPLIIFFHIPAMRSLIFMAISCIKKKRSLIKSVSPAPSVA